MFPYLELYRKERVLRLSNLSGLQTYGLNFSGSSGQNISIVRTNVWKELDSDILNRLRINRILWRQNHEYYSGKKIFY